MAITSRDALVATLGTVSDTNARQQRNVYLPLVALKSAGTYHYLWATLQKAPPPVVHDRVTNPGFSKEFEAEEAVTVGAADGGAVQVGIDGDSPEPLGLARVRKLETGQSAEYAKTLPDAGSSVSENGGSRKLDG